MKHDTFDRRIQLGASRRRLKDSLILYQEKRWAGAIYMGGYAIECSLKSLICYSYNKNNLKKISADTQTHSLTLLLQQVPSMQRAITLDRTNTYKPAWNKITMLWQKDQLRYWDKDGNRKDCQQFIEAVKELHRYILSAQGET